MKTLLCSLLLFVSFGLIAYDIPPNSIVKPGMNDAKSSADSISALIGKRTLIMLDGVKISRKQYESIDPGSYASVVILNPELATRRYGRKGKKGIVMLTSKSAAIPRPNTDKKADVTIFTEAEQMPQFPGGEAALKYYISSHLRYPHEAEIKGIQGKVFVWFVINKLGKVERVKLARGVNPILDEEAIRVVSQMPDWKPGMINGKAVYVSFTMPIVFAFR